ncbi:hypothetical protein NKH77_16980 [Streptomyces sp. M19]
MDGGAHLPRGRAPLPVTNWLVATVGRDRSYDISAARAERAARAARAARTDLTDLTDLGYRPRTSLDIGLEEKAPQPANLDADSA